jgi:hypothetical protein
MTTQNHKSDLCHRPSLFNAGATATSKYRQMVRRRIENRSATERFSKTNTAQIGYERPLPETLPAPAAVSNSMSSNKAILHLPVEFDSLYMDKG